MLLGSALLLCATASTAAASANPECSMPESWDRPGLDRPHQLDCSGAWGAELASGPAHGRLTGFAFDSDAQVASWRYRADDDAPADDAFSLRLTGPGGTTTERVAIHITPRDQNTAPQCQPASAAQRTAGTSPAVVAVDLYCWDYENDSFVIDGGGPGEHVDGPLTVRGGDAGGADSPTWHYRTATSRGNEQTTFWATDDLGARSPDTALSVQVGPDVDRLPACLPEPGTADPSADVLPIYARPGATRRFGVVCSDADHDPLTVRLGTPPARGTLTKFAPGGLEDHDWGTERWVDAVYRPADASGAQDPFSVVAAAHGRTTETKLAITNADDPRWFSSLGCSTNTATTTAGAPGVVRFSCADDDGDDLQATVTRAPEHGAAAPAVLTPARYGWDDVAVAWTPEPGFVGIDTVGVRISDGHGVALDLSIDLYVYAAEAAQSAALPASGQPSVGQAAAVAPADQARAALGTRDVVQVRRLGDARVFARRTAVRRGLAARSGTTALAVTCPLTCRVDARANQAKLRRASAGPAGAARIRLSRRAASLLRSSRSVAFTLSARMPAGRTGHGTIRLHRR
jgi:Bacterial Ig domain